MNMRVTINGVTYRDAKQAAAVHGVTVGRIYQAIEKDGIVGRPSGQAKTAKAIEVLGVRFRSYSDCAAAYGVPAVIVSQMMKFGGVEAVEAMARKQTQEGRV